MNKCNACGKPMRALQQTCQCGWAGEPEKPKAEIRRAHFKCEYETGSERCPAYGTMSSHVGRGERKWFCTPHYHARSDPTGSQLILQDYKANGVPRVKPWIQTEIEKRKELREVNLAKAMQKIAKKNIGSR